MRSKENLSKFDLGCEKEMDEGAAATRKRRKGWDQQTPAGKFPRFIVKRGKYNQIM